MAISHVLLREKYAKGKCILCKNDVDRATVGNLCNSCKDGFAVNFMPIMAIRNEFAM